MDAVIRSVRRRAFAIGGVAIVVAFAIGWRSGVSLTIGAAVVILSFLVLEKLTERLVPRQARATLRTLVPLLLVTAGSLVLLTVVLWRWRGFDPVAGAVGLSVVVLAVVPELWPGRDKGD
jgi:uncharacterized membrane protein